MSATSETGRCPNCGADLPQDVPRGLCPGCALGDALAIQPTGPSAEKLDLNDIPLPPTEKMDSGKPGQNQAHASAASMEKPGDRIGRYKLLQQIGEGGCGIVYMAEQEEPVRRRVALKVIKAGMDTRQVLARFEAERQALALMDHPNIARVLEAGATATGRPFFVMELVRGIPITTFCDENRYATRQRLDLFIQVCHAVQHAHQKDILKAQGKLSEAEKTLGKALTLAPAVEKEKFLWERARAFGRRGHWQQVASDLDALVKLHPDNSMMQLLLALVWIKVGDTEAYRHHRDAMLTRFKDTQHPVLAEQTVKACLLLPASPKDMETLNHLADIAWRTSVEPPWQGYLEFAKGLAEYRSGRAENSVGWMKRILARDGTRVDARLTVQACSLEAMSYAAMHKWTEARAALDKALEFASRLSTEHDAPDLGNFYHDCFMAFHFLEEARSAITIGQNQL